MFTRGRRELPDRVPGAFEHDRRIGQSGVLAIGSLACERCDAPIGIGSSPLSPATALTCPFCAHSAPLRDFLSLATPTRPARVLVRVTTR